MTMSLDVSPVRGCPGLAVSGQPRIYHVEVLTKHLSLSLAIGSFQPFELEIGSHGR